MPGHARVVGSVLLCLCLASHARVSNGSEGNEGVPAHMDGTALPQPKRLVAIGDIHGDLIALKVALRTAGVLHATRDTWIGGRTVVVQVGDQLDRGDDELAKMQLKKVLSSDFM